MGFIENDDGMATLRGLEGIKSSANGGHHGGGGEGWFLAEDVEDIAIQAGGDRGGATEAEEGIAIDIDGIEKGANSGGFATADITGKNTDPKGGFALPCS